MRRKVVGWRREVAFDVVSAGIVVRVQQGGVIVKGGWGLHYLILREFLDSRKLNARHPVRCVPMIACRTKTVVNITVIDHNLNKIKSYD